MAQQLGTVNMTDYKDIFARKMSTIFPNLEVREQAKRELIRYGKEKPERESYRIYIAILKVAGPSLEDIRQWVNIAKQDYRDVLASAEYPNQINQKVWELSEDEQQKIENIDTEQYRKWIEEEK